MLIYIYCQLIGQSTDYVAKKVFLKYPSSFVNLTSQKWNLKGNENEIIIAVKFQSRSNVGQIFNVQFLKSNGNLQALLSVGIFDGFFNVDFYDELNKNILNKPITSIPINLNEVNLALGINLTTKKIWYRIGQYKDFHLEIEKSLDLSNSKLFVTLGGGSRSMIGCVSLIAILIDNQNPVADVNVLSSQDIDNCPAVDECTTRDCNKGICKLLEVPFCDCFSTGFTGPNCRKLGGSIKLQNNDENDNPPEFIQFKPWASARKITRLSMDFKFSDPESNDGILIYGKTTNFQEIFKIYVVGTKGNVVIQNKNKNENLFEFDLRNDHNRFHSIVLEFNGTLLNFLADEQFQHSKLKNPIEFEIIQFGSPITHETVSDTGLTACIKNVYVDHFDIIELIHNKDQRANSTHSRSCGNQNDLSSDLYASQLFLPDSINFDNQLNEKNEESEEEEPEEEEEEGEGEGKEEEGEGEAEGEAEGEGEINIDSKIPLIESNDSNSVKKTKISLKCENSQKFMCQNGANCKIDENEQIVCLCRDGFIGKFCQFTTFPKSCAEASDFRTLPDGPTKIDVDGSKKLEASVAKCVNGITFVDHDMPPNTKVRSNQFSNNSLFIISYRDFKRNQLTKLLKNSGICSQTIHYRCNKAPIRFSNGKTWFRAALNSTKKIQQMGRLPNSCDCIEKGCQAGDKCNCDSGAISSDEGVFIKENAGITEIVTIRDEADVSAEINLGVLSCSGYEKQEEAIRFVKKTELKISSWSGSESIDLQFRTNDVNVTIFGIIGKNDENLLQISILDGHNLNLRHLDTVKTISSLKKINNSQWHHILVEFSDGQIRFSLDDKHILIPITEGAILEGEIILSDKNEGFIGCIRSVRINDDILSLFSFVDNISEIKKGCLSKCSSNFCQNDAKCYENFISEIPFCQCSFPSIHSGKNCEIDINFNSSISFHGGHLKYKNLIGILLSNIYFSFRTDQSDALLLFAHDENNNFLQIHLSDEVNLTLTLTNLNVVSKCTVQAKNGKEFSDMKWIQIAVTHSETSTKFQVEDVACTIRNSRQISSTPITQLFNIEKAEFVRLPIGLSSPIKPDPFNILFIADVDSEEINNDGSIFLNPRYDSPIPKFYGCLRGLQINGTLIDMRQKIKNEDFSKIQNRIGCDVNCESTDCKNGGHCSIDWTKFNNSEIPDPSCNCFRTSYDGPQCTIDNSIQIQSNGFINFNIGEESSRFFIDQSKHFQIFKFAFSSNFLPGTKIPIKQTIAIIDFHDEKKFEIELNPNRTINVSIKYSNKQTEVVNFNGNFADGFRHFFIAKFNSNKRTTVMIDSFQHEFSFKQEKQNLDLFKAILIRIGFSTKNFEEEDEKLKSGFEGCISNLLINFQFEHFLSFNPIEYLNNPNHRFNSLIETFGITKGTFCKTFRIPNSLPEYQNTVEFPIWETSFKRLTYFGPIDVSEKSENPIFQIFKNYPILWIFIICFIILCIAIIIFCIFMKCCQQKFSNNSPNRSFDEEDDLLKGFPNNYRPPQPSPPIQTKSAMSNYFLPNPNVDFNNRDENHSRATSITSSGISGYFTAQGEEEENKKNDFYNDEDDDDDDDDDIVTLSPSLDESSDAETIRYIDDNNEPSTSTFSNSPPSNIRNIPRRVSSLKSGDSTVPRDSPLYSEPNKQPSLLQVSIPVPPQ